MLHLELRFEDGTVELRSLTLPLLVGRAPECDLRLKAWRVARRHARIERCDGGVFLEDLGALAGTLLNGQRVIRHGPLEIGDEIIVGPCQIRVRQIKLENRPEPGEPKTPDVQLMTASAGISHNDPGRQVRVASAGDAKHADDVLPPFHHGEAKGAVRAVVHAAAPNQTFDLQTRLHHRRRLHAALLETLDLRRRDIANMSDETLRGEATMVMAQIIDGDTELPATLDRNELLLEVVNEAVGLGPLEPLLADHAISEIMVNRYDEIFVESDGRIKRHSSGFSSEQAVLGVIERIVSPLGRRIDESSPMVDARLRDGSRVNAVIGPVALRGASLTIRKFPHKRPSIDDLVRIGALDTHMQTFLAACVQYKKNIIVSGGTGSGKTTLLNVLSNCIPAGERIVTIEDAAELRLNHEHLVALESRPANLEGRGKIDIRDLVRNALRMRPDRIVIGECRGGEAFDMLAAMNTGHEGSLTTLHANSPRDALARLETMILMAGMDLPLAAVREHVAASINLIVQQARLSDGRRLITSIVEVTGTESGRIQTQELFHYLPGPPPGFEGCGVVPDCFFKAVDGNLSVSAELFNHRTVLSGSARGFDC